MANSVESFGKYVLLEKLATGGMAEVFLARGTGAGGIGKFFAVKRILPQYAESPEFIEMFKDEAKIAINLSHSNIVSIHEFGVEKGQFFLVMDYVEGRNLRQILNKMKKSNLDFSMEQIVFVIKEVAAGLDHAHRCIDGSTGKPLNITHRDMSPQNVMISFEGETKIVDFGIAKAESQIENTRAGTLKGKFGYMSPEQAEGQPVDLRTDIFSLGIVMWELLANDRLFVANNEINTLRKIRDCQIPSLRKINPNMHTELERIVQKSLARDRNLRYQTGAALHRDLNRFLNRQYPDFSAQDFSVFIKSVFADEILSLRKRLVEYARVQVAPPEQTRRAARDDQTEITRPNDADSGAMPMNEDSTSLLDTNTNSLVGTPGPGTDSHAISLHESETDGPLEISVVKHLEGSAPASVLDDDALAGYLEHSAPKDRQSLETEKIRERSVVRHTRRANQNGAGEFTKARREETRPPARFATILVFALLSLGVYSYLIKYYPGTMRGVIAATSPFAGRYYCALGAIPCGGSVADQRDPAGQRTALMNGSVNAPTSAPASGSAGAASTTAANPGAANPAAANPSATAAAAGDNDPNGLVVSSNPSGAEIYVNDQPTNMVTPSRVEVPPRANFTIAVRKRGYKDYRMTDVTRESLGHRFDADLMKLNVGYVDIEFFPPQDAILYVNGKQVGTQRNAAREVAVPGGTPVKIRAESRGANTFDEITVTVATDQKKFVQLNPRKTTRAPSSNP